MELLDWRVDCSCIASLLRAEERKTVVRLKDNVALVTGAYRYWQGDGRTWLNDGSCTGSVQSVNFSNALKKEFYGIEALF